MTKGKVVFSNYTLHFMAKIICYSYSLIKGFALFGKVNFHKCQVTSAKKNNNKKNQSKTNREMLLHSLASKMLEFANK